MAKALTIASAAIALVLLLLFGLDLAVGIPFGRVNPVMSIGFVVFSLILGYLCWSSWRELT